MAKKASWEEEEGDVADAWDAEEEEVVVVASAAPPVAAPAKKKKEPAAGATLQGGHYDESAEERKARLERLVMESDLVNAMSLFGIEGGEAAARPAAAAAAVKQYVSPFDTSDPRSTKDFEAFAALIAKRCEGLSDRAGYGAFVEALVAELVGKRPVAEIRKVAGTLTSISSQRVREESARGAGKSGASQLPTIKAGKKAGGGRFDDFDARDASDPFDY